MTELQELVMEVRKRTEENWDELMNRVKAEVDSLKIGVKYWPVGQCQYASINLSEQLQLVVVSGEYLGTSQRLLLNRHHVWDWHEESDRMIDATIHQYNRNFPEILVVKQCDPLFRRLYKSWRYWISQPYDSEVDIASIYGY